VHGGLVAEELEQAIGGILKSKPKAQAILICGDSLTTNCLRYLKHHRVSIPKDIAVIGFSNHDLGELLNPALTTVYQPAFQIGGYATELLLQMIESKNEIKKFEYKKFPCELFVRDSAIKKT
jgi:DNA-binding LacI/PurR family transcriptional regulator